jgi:hypothetical protein
MKDLEKISAAIPLGGGRLEFLMVKVNGNSTKAKANALQLLGARYAMQYRANLCIKQAKIL